MPDLRRRLQGCDRFGLSGADAPRRAVHGLPADRVSGWPRRGLVAGAGSNHRARRPHQPGDGPPRAAFRHRRHVAKNISSTNSSWGWMRALSPPDLSAAINDLCKRYSVDLAALSREAAMDWDDLAKLAADPLVTIGSATVNYPVAVEPEGRRRAARDDDGQGGGAGCVPPRGQAFRLSVRRSRSFAPAACRDGRGGRFCQCGVGAAGRGSRRGPNQSARAAAAFLGRPAALAARHAGAAVRAAFAPVGPTRKK